MRRRAVVRNRFREAFSVEGGGFAQECEALWRSSLYFVAIERPSASVFGSPDYAEEALGFVLLFLRRVLPTLEFFLCHIRG